jgi:hypothetical protein
MKNLKILLLLISVLAFSNVYAFEVSQQSSLTLSLTNQKTGLVANPVKPAKKDKKLTKETKEKHPKSLNRTGKARFIVGLIYTIIFGVGLILMIIFIKEVILLALLGFLVVLLLGYGIFEMVRGLLLMKQGY